MKLLIDLVLIWQIGFGWGINHKEAFQGCDIHFDVFKVWLFFF